MFSLYSSFNTLLSPLHCSALHSADHQISRLGALHGTTTKEKEREIGYLENSPEIKTGDRGKSRGGRRRRRGGGGGGRTDEMRTEKRSECSCTTKTGWVTKANFWAKQAQFLGMVHAKK